jgi:hypothetical protein
LVLAVAIIPKVQRAIKLAKKYAGICIFKFIRECLILPANFLVMELAIVGK